jgi:hypothetical protein
MNKAMFFSLILVAVLLVAAALPYQGLDFLYVKRLYLFLCAGVVFVLVSKRLQRQRHRLAALAVLASFALYLLARDRCGLRHTALLVAGRTGRAEGDVQCEAGIGLQRKPTHRCPTLRAAAPSSHGPFDPLGVNP